MDGGQHAASESDKQRDDWLQEQGFQILRFWNNEVLGETELVLEKILQVVAPSPQPLFHEGSGDKELARLKWRCRRGLLELDIVLGRFVERGYASLNESEKIEFDVLLDLPDNTLWDRITGKEQAENETQKKMLELINAA